MTVFGSGPQLLDVFWLRPAFWFVFNCQKLYRHLAVCDASNIQQGTRLGCVWKCSPRLRDRERESERGSLFMTVQLDDGCESQCFYWLCQKINDQKEGEWGSGPALANQKWTHHCGPQWIAATLQPHNMWPTPSCSNSKCLPRCVDWPDPTITVPTIQLLWQSFCSPLTS